MRNILEVNSLTVNYVKQGTFRYVQQVMQEGLGIRYGNSFSSYIEAEAYYKPDGTQEINEGDEIVYIQELNVDDEFEPITPAASVSIGKFTVKKIVKSKKSYLFIAYDNLEKLNASYSEHLFDNKSSFPNNLKVVLDQLVNYASNDLGVTITINELDAYNLSTPTSQIMDYFYTDGISYKDILSHLAELSFQYMQCDSNGDVHFKRFSTASANGYWKNSDRYIIAPTDQVTYTGTALINGTSQTVTLFPVFYKQDGLSHESYAFKGTQDLLVKNIKGETWHSIDLLPKTVNNPYIIQKNPFVDKLTLTTQGKHDLFDFGFAAINSLTGGRSISPVEVHLFPFRNPFNAGQILPHIEDADGNRFSSVVMKMEQTDSEVIITCSGTEYYYTSASENYDNEENAQFLNVAVNDLYEIKVNKSGDTMTGALTLNTPLAIASGGTGASSAADGAFNLQTKPWKSTSAINSTNPRTLSFSGSSGIVYFAFTGGNNANNMGAYIIYSGGASATPVIKNVSAASNLTLTAATGKITISSSSSANCYMYLVCMSANAYNNLTVS